MNNTVAFVFNHSPTGFLGESHILNRRHIGLIRNSSTVPKSQRFPRALKHIATKALLNFENNSTSSAVNLSKASSTTLRHKSVLSSLILAHYVLRAKAYPFVALSAVPPAFSFSKSRNTTSLLRALRRICLKVEHLARPALGEFLAVFAFVLSIHLASLSSFSIAITPLALFVIVYAFLDISGAHLNPMVSLLMLLERVASPARTVIYIIAQILGACCGAHFGNFLVPNIAAPVFGPGVSIAKAFLVEFSFSWLLAILILVANRKQATKTDLGLFLFLVVIMAFIVVTSLTVGPISGASFNAAIAFGFMSVKKSFQHWLVYASASFLGGSLGFFTHRVLHPPLGIHHWITGREKHF